MATATITPDQNAVIAEIFIAAPPARVFQAISDPAQLPKWWGQSDLYQVTKSTMDVRPAASGAARASAPTASPSSSKANISKSIPRACSSIPGSAATTPGSKRLCAGNWSPRRSRPAPSGPKKSGTGTLVRVRQEGFAGKLESAKSHGEGWKRVLGWLQAFAETPAARS
jgi:uncharacterized protein YndB with AHSA1/START domain